MNFSIIAAVDKNFGIGKGGTLPWDLKGDLKHFREVTKGCAVIMGRGTWVSLPDQFRPLPGRINAVLCREGELNLPEGVLRVSSIDEALELLEQKGASKIFVIGGGMVYAQAVKHPKCEEIYLTEIDNTFECDTHFPPLPTDFKKISTSEPVEESGIVYSFAIYKRS